jgi:hypothetical protein
LTIYIYIYIYIYECPPSLPVPARGVENKHFVGYYYLIG